LVWLIRFLPQWPFRIQHHEMLYVWKFLMVVSFTGDGNLMQPQVSWSLAIINTERTSSRADCTYKELAVELVVLILNGSLIESMPTILYFDYVFTLTLVCWCHDYAKCNELKKYRWGFVILSSGVKVYGGTRLCQCDIHTDFISRFNISTLYSVNLILVVCNG
jgi:hypothetical protein